MVTLIACAMLFAGLVVLIISLVLDIIYKTRFDLEYLDGACSWEQCGCWENRSCASCLFPMLLFCRICASFVVMLCPVPIMFYIEQLCSREGTGRSIMWQSVSPV